VWAANPDGRWAPASPEGLRLGLGLGSLNALVFIATLILNLPPSTKAKRWGTPVMQSATNQRNRSECVPVRSKRK
jgi:hypothetical protein